MPLGKIPSTSLDDGARRFPIGLPSFTPTNSTYVMCWIVPTGQTWTFEQIKYGNSSGTNDAQLRIDGVPVTWAGPLTTLACSGTPATKAATANNVASAGAMIEWVVSNVSSPVGHSWTAIVKVS